MLSEPLSGNELGLAFSIWTLYLFFYVDCCINVIFVI